MIGECRTVTVQRGSVRIDAGITRLGADILISVYGGDTPHIGCIASAGRQDETKVIVFPGHRDGDVLIPMADKLAGIAPGRVCVAGGIHIDHITKEQILLVKELCEELTDKLCEVTADYDG